MVEILQPGILATIQDLGRPGFRDQGVNPGGVMDPFAARAANRLVGNEESCAVLEMHFPAPRLRFTQTAMVAIGGADFAGHAGALAVRPWKPHLVPADSVLEFREPRWGARAYLAVQGGWQVEAWLGSRSTHTVAGLGGYHGRALRVGDRLDHLPQIHFGQAASIDPEPIYRRERVTVVTGPEWDWLTDDAQRQLLDQEFVIGSDSNRIGYRLQSTPLARRDPREMLSSGTAFGTLQLLPSGQVILLMADHGVTGGYPRIAVVVSDDFPFLAQQGAGAVLRFQAAPTSEVR